MKCWQLQKWRSMFILHLFTKLKLFNDPCCCNSLSNLLHFDILGIWYLFSWGSAKLATVIPVIQEHPLGRVWSILSRLSLKICTFFQLAIYAVSTKLTFLSKQLHGISTGNRDMPLRTGTARCASVTVFTILSSFFGR